MNRSHNTRKWCSGQSYRYQENGDFAIPYKNKVTEIVEIIKETYKREPTGEEWDIILRYPYNEIMDQIHFLNVTEEYISEKSTLQTDTPQNATKTKKK